MTIIPHTVKYSVVVRMISKIQGSILPFQLFIRLNKKRIDALIVEHEPQSAAHGNFYDRLGTHHCCVCV